MAINHFEKHREQIGRIDWNFNLLFNDQPQVPQLAAKYAPLLQHPGLHKPVPGQWLHATVLRVGFLEDFTETEMLAVADRLEHKLTNMKMSELRLEKWWLWNGGPVLGITPKRQLYTIYGYLMESLIEVIGRDRLPTLSIPPRGRFETAVASLLRAIGRDRIPIQFQFLPHITLAYPKTYNAESSLSKQLKSQAVEGVNIRVKSVSLIKQYILDDYYAWEIVKDIQIPQDT